MASSPPPLPRQAIRCLSWNVWAHYIVSGKGVHARLQAAAATAASTGADVVLVQELFQGKLGLLSFTGYTATMAAAMAKAGFGHHTRLDATRPWVVGQSSGLAVFSKFPLSEEEHVTFTTSGERLNTKGFVRVRVGAPAPFYAINTHLDSRSNAVKRLQWAELVAHVATLPASAPLVVAGDFNVCQQPVWDPATYPALAGAFREAGMVDLFSGGDVVTFPADGAAYDHMFVREGTVAVDVAVVDADGASDHDGIVATLQW